MRINTSRFLDSRATQRLASRSRRLACFAARCCRWLLKDSPPSVWRLGQGGDHDGGCRHKDGHRSASDLHDPRRMKCWQLHKVRNSVTTSALAVSSQAAKGSTAVAWCADHVLADDATDFHEFTRPCDPPAAAQPEARAPARWPERSRPTRRLRPHRCLQTQSC